MTCKRAAIAKGLINAVRVDRALADGSLPVTRRTIDNWRTYKKHPGLMFKLGSRLWWNYDVWKEILAKEISMRAVNAMDACNRGELPIAMDTIYTWKRENRYPGLIVKLGGKLWWNWDVWQLLLEEKEAIQKENKREEEGRSGELATETEVDEHMKGYR